jgi:hypothetical protein
MRRHHARRIPNNDRAGRHVPCDHCARAYLCIRPDRHRTDDDRAGSDHRPILDHQAPRVGRRDIRAQGDVVKDRNVVADHRVWVHNDSEAVMAQPYAAADLDLGRDDGCEHDVDHALDNLREAAKAAPRKPVGKAMESQGREPHSPRCYID